MANFADIVIDPQELEDGYEASQLFSSPDCMGITFDDLISLPGSITFGVHDVDLSTHVTRRYKLTNPLCSTPMDTVTEHDMAIGMALHGGLGIIHCKCSIEEQVAMVEKVKGFENGFILEPVVFSPQNKIKDLDIIREKKKISGVPITIDGKLKSKLVGFVSNKDTDFIADRNKLLSEVMTPIESMTTGTYPMSIADANHILKVRVA